jgi:hypothetical protein
VKNKQEIVLTEPNNAPLYNISALQGSPALGAHIHLLDCSSRMQLRAQPHSSVLSAVKLYDVQGRYLFSWIINKNHLLFYIRKPALKLVPSLGPRALHCLTAVKLNPAAEVTIRLETVADAKALSDWLFSPDTWNDEKHRGLPYAHDKTVKMS